MIGTKLFLVIVAAIVFAVFVVLPSLASLPYVLLLAAFILISPWFWYVALAITVFYLLMRAIQRHDERKEGLTL